MSFSCINASAVKLIQNSLSTGRLPHAILLTGDNMPLIEKIALNLTKALFCVNPPARGASGLPLDSCDLCDACIKVQENLCPDILWIRPESKLRLITIGQIRELIRIIQLKPMLGGFKVGIISNADRLNKDAANAFLKTLEEPPAKSLLILLSDQPDKIIDTILSRCFRITCFTGDLIAWPENDLAWFMEIVKKLPAKPLGIIGKYSLIGKLLRRLADIKKETQEFIEKERDLSKYENISEESRELIEAEIKASIEAEYRRRRALVIEMFIRWFRDIWAISYGLKNVDLNFPELKEVSAMIATRTSSDVLQKNIQTLFKTQRRLETNAHETLVLEVMFLSIVV